MLSTLNFNLFLQKKPDYRYINAKFYTIKKSFLFPQNLIHYIVLYRPYNSLLIVLFVAKSNALGCEIVYLSTHDKINLKLKFYYYKHKRFFL